MGPFGFNSVIVTAIYFITIASGGMYALQGIRFVQLLKRRSFLAKIVSLCEKLHCGY